MTLPMPLAWSAVARDYARHIVPGLRPAARALCSYLDVRAGERVLDVACGPGTAALVAHELGARVVGVDYAEEMIVLARELGAGRTELEFQVANALALPLPDESFDVVLSNFGVIFAPEPERAVREMARVLVEGGRAGLTAWPRAGTMGEYYDLATRYIVMPESTHDPHSWGDPERAGAWFGVAFDVLLLQSLDVPFHAPSAAEAWRVLRTSTGRVAVGYAALEPEARRAMDADMEAYFRGFAGTDGRVEWPREALVVCGSKRLDGEAVT